MITLRKINMDNFKLVLNLELDEMDQKMVAPNMYSLAEAYADQVSICRGIYHDDALVGFIMYDYNEKEQCGYISRLMVDRKHQRKGYAKAALSLALEHLKTYEGINKIQISYEPNNIKAKSLYEALGFIENGKVVDDETVAIIELK